MKNKKIFYWVFGLLIIILLIYRYFFYFDYTIKDDFSRINDSTSVYFVFVEVNNLDSNKIVYAGSKIQSLHKQYQQNKPNSYLVVYFYSEDYIHTPPTEAINKLKNQFRGTDNLENKLLYYKNCYIMTFAKKVTSKKPLFPNKKIFTTSFFVPKSPYNAKEIFQK